MNGDIFIRIGNLQVDKHHQ